MPMQQNTPEEMRESLQKAIKHLEHVLPGQYPLKDFVHHNTLHGYQHLTFSEALTTAHKTTGIYGYLSQQEYRTLLKNGRITLEELAQVVSEDAALNAQDPLFRFGDFSLTKSDVYLCGLQFSFQSLTASQLTWNIEERNVLQRFQPEVSLQSRDQLLQSSQYNKESEVISDLWGASLEALGLAHYIMHPEELIDLSADQAEAIMQTYIEDMATDDHENNKVRHRMRKDGAALLKMLFKRVGKELTLRGLLQAVTGEDIMENIRPLLIRHLSNHLDQGIAAWHNKERSKGFYASWRSTAAIDLSWAFDDSFDWQYGLVSTPENAYETVISELNLLGLAVHHWQDYLQALALELPGWSAMVLWRQLHPGYEGLNAKVEIIDYLAVRLVLERLFAQQLCRRVWKIAPNLDLLRWYFRDNHNEFLVRYALFNLRLPEYIVSCTNRMLKNYNEHHSIHSDEWRYLAHLIWTWRQSPAANRPKGHNVYRSGWRLFCLAQHLGISGDVMRRFSKEEINNVLQCLDKLTENKAGFLWLQAYENHYRDQIFNAVMQNHGRGRWQSHELRPQAQIVFCMDDREEGIRRHLEEHNPAIETLGAAGFFGVAINWKALDADKPVSLCPIVVTPQHEIRETVQPGKDTLKQQHDRRRNFRLKLVDALLIDTRHQLLASTLNILLAAPLALFTLIGKILAPLKAEKLLHSLLHQYEPAVPTTITLTANDACVEPSEAHNRLGFSEAEQVDRVKNFLRTIGLTKGFAPLAIIMGHGSVSENNPHEAAHDCGACSGRHGGPNARVFAAMANRPEVRTQLRQLGIDIPKDTWFVGAMHNTCDETYSWYDLPLMPEAFAKALQKVREDLEIASYRSAHERCRKFDSAPVNPLFKLAYDHVQTRSYDISQVRPEYGHATNAVAFIGRRALSQGAFFDRRVFLISYDPTQDTNGLIIENILLNAGPVGAGINLEYYFSTVNNDLYGCSSKITHNITGFFGVMDGISSDLRTGLPLQMVEIHEAMRLQVLVEAHIDTLTKIYQRQSALQELVGNGWILLSAKNPDTAEIHVFKPEQGWVLWQGDDTPLTTVNNSMDWYAGHKKHLPPALITQPGKVEYV